MIISIQRASSGRRHKRACTEFVAAAKESPVAAHATSGEASTTAASKSHMARAVLTAAPANDPPPIDSGTFAEGFATLPVAQVPPSLVLPMASTVRNDQNGVSAHTSSASCKTHRRGCEDGPASGR